jgi:1,4-alpha-glucan branching enzyme
MNDSLRYYGREPIYRQYHHHEMTFAMAYAYSENFVLPISHDEVVHGKGSMFERAPQDEWRKFGTMRAFYAFMWAHPGKKLLFMGTEFGQRREFSESRSIDWDQSAHWGHRGVQRLIKDLNAIYTTHPALYKLDNDPAGFRWINADDAGGNVFSWVRFDGEGQMIACIVNFSSESRPDYRVGLPAEGAWQEVLNTDAEVYDGTGQIGNLGQVIAHPVPSNGFPASANVTIPPLGAVWLLHQAEPTEESDEPDKVEAGTRAAAKQASPKPTRPRGQVIGVPEDGEQGQPAAESPATRPATTKAAAKKTATKKTAAKKTATAHAPEPEPAAEKAPATKVAAKKTAAKKTAKNAPVKKTVEQAADVVEHAAEAVEHAAEAVKKAAKKATAKKTAAKKSTSKKAAPPPES